GRPDRGDDRRHEQRRIRQPDTSPQAVPQPGRPRPGGIGYRGRVAGGKMADDIRGVAALPDLETRCQPRLLCPHQCPRAPPWRLAPWLDKRRDGAGEVYVRAVVARFTDPGPEFTSIRRDASAARRSRP